MEVVLVACVAKNGVIGDKGKLPWRIKEELQHFKRVVIDYSHVACGFNTAISLPEALIYRLNDNKSKVHVVSHKNWVLNQRLFNSYNSFEELHDKMYSNGISRLFVIGGAATYKQALDGSYVDKMIITHLPDSYAGDVYFPEYDKDDFSIIKEEKRELFTIREYAKKVYKNGVKVVNYK